MKSYRIKMLLLTTLLTVVTALSGQTNAPYHFSLKRDLLYTGGGVGLSLVGYALHQNVPNISRSDLALRTPPRFDRFAIDLFSEKAAQASDGALFVSLGLPALLVFSQDTRSDWAQLGLLYGEVLLFNQGFTDIIKSTVKRPRPYVLSPDFPVDQPIESNDRAAFLSGHTSVSAASCFFMARVFADYHPQSRLRPYVWGLAAGLPALTGYLRVKAGRHYLSDVVAGYALGAALGYFVPALHRRSLRVKGLQVAVGQGSAYLCYRFPN
ncbi:MAG: hypothetical protein DA408_15305 [Bacteroidetes bacterium]|nr:MAG: hypothetical protein DA408_15305 [Bacteroidota bacterium]